MEDEKCKELALALVPASHESRSSPQTEKRMKTLGFLSLLMKSEHKEKILS